MNESIQDSRLATLLKLDSWPVSEREAFLEKSGQLILDASIARLLLSLSESELAQLEFYFDSHDDVEDMIGYLSDSYPRFVDILGEESAAFQVEAEQIISPAS